MSETTQDPNTKKGLITPLIITALLIYFVASNPDRAWNILLVLLGFSMVIFVHELGHFLAAKAVGIQTEEFAIGFGKVLLGIKKVKNGLEFRLLPIKLPDGGRKSAYTFTLPFGSARQGETEYQLRMIPLGGFVKMLGQEDLGADKPSDNPRSFGNKAIWKRVIVISAGVTVNVITGFIVFLAVFNHGVDLPPAVIGEIFSGSVAEKAGLEPGDEVLAINGQENISFMDLKLASAFTGKDESLDLKIKKDDGTTINLSIQPQSDEKQGMKIMGVLPASTLTLMEAKNIQGDDREHILASLKDLGLNPADTIVAANGQTINKGHELFKALNPEPGQGSNSITLTVRRPNSLDGESAEKQVVVSMRPQTINVYLTKKLGIEPLISVSGFAPQSPARQAGMKQGDLITKVATLANPTSEELTEYVRQHSDQAISFVVQRDETGQTIEKTLEITPRKPSGWQKFLGNKNPPRIGIRFSQSLPGRSLQAEAIVAQTQSVGENHPVLALPRGAKITAIAGQAVANWQEVLTQLENHHGQTIELQYRLSDQQDSAPLTLAIPEEYRAELAYRSDNEIIPILPALLKAYERTFKGSNWTQSLRMGTTATKTFLAQSYLTIKSMITGSMSTKNVSGPVGILTLSYNIVDSKSMTFYFYFMAIISMCIAVFNFLPIPIVDGGLIVMLLIEKIKGSPVSLRVQEVINYAGLIMIGGFFLYVTFNDIARLFNG